MSSSPLRRHSLAVGTDASPSRLPQPAASPSSPSHTGRSVSSSGLPVFSQGRSFSPAMSRTPSDRGNLTKNGLNAAGSPLPARFGKVSSREQLSNASLSIPKGQNQDTLPDADGHVQVVLRIRPSYTPPESDIPQRFQRVVLRPNPSNPSHEVIVQQPSELVRTAGTVPANPLGSAKGKSNSFRYDRILPEECTQVEAYEVSAKPAIDKFLKGFNVTILATGGDLQTGIIPRAVKDMFEKLEQDRTQAAGGLTWECKVSFLELYNEDLIDLLSKSSHNQSSPVTIREDKGKILWSGLREVKVTSTEEVMRLLHEGSTRRQIGETGMNKESSRSHAVFSLSLVQRKRSDNGARTKNFSRPISTPVSAYSTLSRGGTPTSTRPGSRTSMMPPPTSAIRQFATSPSTPGRGNPDEDTGSIGWVEVISKFHFVDLAGSERLKRTAALGDRMKEGISINAGLTALGNVISALAEPASKHAHIPYRDSKLTRLLQDSLGGNSYTIMIACVSPIEYNLNETINTLRYGSRARNIKNRAEANQVEVGWDDLVHLQGVIIKLRKELEVLKQASEREDLADLDGSSARDDLIEQSRSKLSAEHELTETLRSQIQMQNLEIARLMKQVQTYKQCKPDDNDTDGMTFSQMVEPIIDEYERTIINLEAEIERLKASLQISETLAEEHAEQITLKSKRLEAQEAYIHELRTRITSYAQRERDLEENIRQLEVQIHTSPGKKGDHSPLTVDLQEKLAEKEEALSLNAKYLAELESRLETADDRIEDLTRQVEELEKEAKEREHEGGKSETKIHQLQQSDKYLHGNTERSSNLHSDSDDPDGEPLVKVPGSPALSRHPSEQVATLVDERQPADYASLKGDHAKTLAELAAVKVQYQEILQILNKMTEETASTEEIASTEEDPAPRTKKKKTETDSDRLAESGEKVTASEKLAEEDMQELGSANDGGGKASKVQVAQDFPAGRGNIEVPSTRIYSSSEQRSSSPSFRSSWGKSGSPAFKAIARARLRQCSPTPGETLSSQLTAEGEHSRFSEPDGHLSRQPNAVTSTIRLLSEDCNPPIVQDKTVENGINGARSHTEHNALTDETYTPNNELSNNSDESAPGPSSQQMAVTLSQATLWEAIPEPLSSSAEFGRPMNIKESNCPLLPSDSVLAGPTRSTELQHYATSSAVEHISPDHGASTSEHLQRQIEQVDAEMQEMRASVQEALSARDNALVNSDLLRGEMAQMQSEIDILRQSSNHETGSLESQLWEERKAKERAQAQVEELMAAMQKMSKFRVSL
ncbi:hypothetical protein QFC19_000075 [Naganishia cerealis]|uniref:Uncharacterized protein n=1 Tax=Naganishia cerealis TaxID=610337 RepID=A0ACC2WTM1_9TREE|nr:hypothetical protein QFC19_000075 [Naganishia cerealis]